MTGLVEGWDAGRGVAGREVMTLLHAILAGGDSIDDRDVHEGRGAGLVLAFQSGLRHPWRTVGTVDLKLDLPQP